MRECRRASIITTMRSKRIPRIPMNTKKNTIMSMTMNIMKIAMTPRNVPTAMMMNISGCL